MESIDGYDEPRHRSLGVPGFTMVELLMVIAILSIAVVVVLPASEITEPYKLDLVANQVANSLRYARAEAIRMDNPHGAHIEATPKRVRVFRGAIGTTPPTPVYDVYHPVTKRLYDLDLDSAATNGGVSLSASATWSAACSQPEFFGFDASGTPRCGDPWSVLLETSALTLTYAGHTRIVVVDAVTGRVTVQ